MLCNWGAQNVRGGAQTEKIRGFSRAAVWLLFPIISIYFFSECCQVDTFILTLNSLICLRAADDFYDLDTICFHQILVIFHFRLFHFHMISVFDDFNNTIFGENVNALI